MKNGARDSQGGLREIKEASVEVVFNSGVKERKDGITVSVQGVNEKGPG